MAIDARIVAVTVIAPESCDVCFGTGKDQAFSWDNCETCHGATKDKPITRLHLEPRQQNGLAGQTVLTVLNAPANMSGVIGTDIWGNSAVIMIGGNVWAKRHGYTAIELVTPEVT